MNDQNNSQDPKQNKAAMDQAALESFVDSLITARKDPQVTDQNREQVKLTLLKELNEDINLHLINLLSEKDQVALDELLDKNPTDDELNKFFMDRIANLQDEVTAALLKFREAYLLPVADEKQSNTATQQQSNATPETLEQAAAPEPAPDSKAAMPPPLPPAPVAPEEK